MDSKGIKRVLERLNEAVALHGGSVSLVRCHEPTKTVHVALTGACSHCSLAEVTLRQFIEYNLKAEFPDIQRIVATQQ